MVSERTSERAFFGVSALLFAASAAVTIVSGGARLPGLGLGGDKCATRAVEAVDQRCPGTPLLLKHA
jgi:hypothetical protein